MQKSDDTDSALAARFDCWSFDTDIPREPDDPRQRADFQFVNDRGAMQFDGALADAEVGRDVFIV